MTPFFSNAKSDTQRKLVVKNLIIESQTHGGYYFMIAISTLIASIGLLNNNSPLIIGAMLMTPLMTPILALGLGITTRSYEAIIRALIGIVNSAATVLFLSFLIGLLTGPEAYKTEEVLLKGSYSQIYILVAFLSGLGATYAWVEHRINSALTGIAVAVSLLPPLCVTGISLAQGDTALFNSSFRVFITNFGGIVASSALMFAIFSFTNLKTYEERKIKKEI